MIWTIITHGLAFFAGVAFIMMVMRYQAKKQMENMKQMMDGAPADMDLGEELEEGGEESV